MHQQYSSYRGHGLAVAISWIVNGVGLQNFVQVFLTKNPYKTNICLIACMFQFHKHQKVHCITLCLVQVNKQEKISGLCMLYHVFLKNLSMKVWYYLVVVYFVNFVDCKNIILALENLIISSFIHNSSFWRFCIKAKISQTSKHRTKKKTCFTVMKFFTKLL